MKAQVAVAVISLLASNACVSPETRRLHAENMSKVEAFKTAFDRDVTAGTPFEEVLRYVNAHNLHFGSSGLTAPDDTPPHDGTSRLTVELFHEEKSIWWYCGRGSVGLDVWF